MPSNRITKEFSEGIYFLTLTIKRLYYIFDRQDRWEIILDSLKYCQENKGLKIYHYVFMLNHIHLIIGCDDTISFIRDFKKYTSKELKRNIIETEPNILKLFLYEDGYNFWQPKNYPEKIESEYFYLEKANYVEQNPVRKKYVRSTEDWIYSSASKDYPLLELDNVYED